MFYTIMGSLALAAAVAIEFSGGDSSTLVVLSAIWLCTGVILAEIKAKR